MNNAPPPPSLQFRPLTVDDQDIVWKLLSFAAHEDSVEVTKSQTCCVPYAQDFGNEKGDLGILATLTITGEPVGGAWIRMLGEEGMSKIDSNDEIPELALAVFPEYRGQGIGTRVLEAFLAMAKQQHDIAAISLSCRVDNVAAMRLYESHGFVRIPNSEVMNRVGGTNVSMKCILQ